LKIFLNECIARILKENKDLSKITVILPTQRLCSIFISLLSKEINSPQFSPNIYSIRDFVSNLSDAISDVETKEKNKPSKNNPKTKNNKNLSIFFHQS